MAQVRKKQALIRALQEGAIMFEGEGVDALNGRACRIVLESIAARLRADRLDAGCVAGWRVLAAGKYQKRQTFVALHALVVAGVITRERVRSEHSRKEAPAINKIHPVVMAEAIAWSQEWRERLYRRDRHGRPENRVINVRTLAKNRADRFDKLQPSLPATSSPEPISGGLCAENAHSLCAKNAHESKHSAAPQAQARPAPAAPKDGKKEDEPKEEPLQEQPPRKNAARRPKGGAAVCPMAKDAPLNEQHVKLRVPLEALERDRGIEIPAIPGLRNESARDERRLQSLIRKHGQARVVGTAQRLMDGGRKFIFVSHLAKALEAEAPGLALARLAKEDAERKKAAPPARVLRAPAPVVSERARREAEYDARMRAAEAMAATGGAP